MPSSGRNAASARPIRVRQVDRATRTRDRSPIVPLSQSRSDPVGVFKARSKTGRCQVRARRFPRPVWIWLPTPLPLEHLLYHWHDRHLDPSHILEVTGHRMTRLGMAFAAGESQRQSVNVLIHRLVAMRIVAPYRASAMIADSTPAETMRVSRPFGLPLTGFDREISVE
jgi:hypothetical protein